MKILLLWVALLPILLTYAIAMDDIPRPKDLTQKSRDDLAHFEDKMREADIIKILAVSADLHGLVGIGADAEGLFELFIYPFLQWKFNDIDVFEDIGTAMALEIPDATRAVLKHELDLILCDHERHNSPDRKFWRVFHEAMTKEISFRCPLGIYTGVSSNGTQIKLHIFRANQGTGYCYHASLELVCCGRSSHTESNVEIDGSREDKFGKELVCTQCNTSIPGVTVGTFNDRYTRITSFTLWLRRVGNRKIWECEELKK